MRKYQVSSIKYQTQQKGFTLLLAALVASIVLSIGAAIFSIAHKQIALSSMGRNSQYAFYAADTAAECALYWDIRHAAFATSSQTRNDLPLITCDGQESDVTFPTAPTATAATSVFEYEPRSGNNVSPAVCARVTIEKTYSAVTGGVVTNIHSDGYSVPCGSTASDQALQRSVELRY